MNAVGADRQTRSRAFIMGLMGSRGSPRVVLRQARRLRSQGPRAGAAVGQGGACVHLGVRSGGEEVPCCAFFFLGKF